jgi:hypothetical protein
MIDEFDELATGTASAAAESECPAIPPAGKNLCMVVEAGRRKNQYKAGKWPENPNGWELSVKLQAIVGEHRVPFTANIPAHRAKVIAKAFESAGLAAPLAGERIDERQLVDRTVEVEVEHYRPEGSDKVFPIVKLWLPPGSVDVDPPGLPPAATKASKPRGAAKATKPVDLAPDDIPF